MKTITKTLIIAVLGTGLIAGLLLVAVWLAGGPGDTQAQGELGPLIVAFDMNTAGNSCPGTGNAGGTNCTLGVTDDCVEVSAGATISFDVVLKDLPAGESFAGPDYYVGWPASLPLTITQPVKAGVGETTVGVNLIADDALSGSFISNSSTVPNAVSPHHATVADLGTAETSPPFTQGVVHRFRATVGAATLAGKYGLFFDQSLAGGPVIMGNKPGEDMCTIYGCILLDANT